MLRRIKEVKSFSLVIPSPQEVTNVNKSAFFQAFV